MQDETVLEVRYPTSTGIGVRGSLAPLSWDHTTQPTETKGFRHCFKLDLPANGIAEIKVIREDGAWAKGRNLSIHRGERLVVEPYFDRDGGELLETERIAHEGETLDYRVYLPPSYDEHPARPYPVLLLQDGQALWAGSGDPFGDWNLNEALDELYGLRAMDEVIAVGIDTSTERVDRLSPVADPTYGGGRGPAHLRAMIDGLLPKLRSKFRVAAGPRNTGVLGSSMGGLFSFYAAWNRPDVFGKAGCLSSSFWFADRYMIRAVRADTCPAPRPLLYIDSGASKSEFELDVNARDGFEHTRAMWRSLVAHCYEPGGDLHTLTFAGFRHDAASWAARIAVPLQLLFPSHVMRVT